MHPNIFAGLLCQVDDKIAHQTSRDEIKSLIRIAAAEYYAGLGQVRGDAVIFARTLLDQGRPRAEIQSRLADNFGLTRRTAYRRIDEAMAMRFLGAAGPEPRESQALPAKYYDDPAKHVKFESEKTTR